MSKMPKLGDFREQMNHESNAAYFKAACFKMAKAKREFDECALNRFVSTVIGRAQKSPDAFVKAYFYLKDRFDFEGELHFHADELLEVA